MTKLTVTKEGDLFVVDDLTRPGSPPVGRGKTILEAIGWWVLNNQKQMDFEFDWTAVKEDLDRWNKKLVKEYERNR
jgi:hypothetical protein